MATTKKSTLEILKEMVNKNRPVVPEFSRVVKVDGIDTFRITIDPEEYSPILMKMFGSYGGTTTLGDPEIGLFFSSSSALSLAAALIDAAMEVK